MEYLHGVSCKVYGKSMDVGVISVAPHDYDPAHWWKSSECGKATTTELNGWAYEALLDLGR